MGLNPKRVSTAFHETFALNLPSICGILELAVENDGNVSDEDIKENVKLGNNYIKAMPRYARASGLLDFPGFKVTKFGQTVSDKDPNLVNMSTLWLMHYHLSAPHGPGPLYWNYVVSNLLRIGDRLDSDTLGKEIARQNINNTGIELQGRTTKDSARVLLKTYSENDALGALGIAVELDGSYLIGEPDPPSEWVIGYALADYWEGVFGDRPGINLSEITSADDFQSIFFMGKGLLLSKLSEMQREGLLQMQRVAPPHQLIKLWPNKEIFLEKIYE